jgi:Raf kinase inhibitor-like YbhB/YbcL family protein
LEGVVMQLTSTAFAEGGRMPVALAFGAIDPDAHVKLAENLSPDLRWSEVPAATKSLALICHDPDVPSRGDDVNKEGRTVPASLPRVDFFHWVLIELAPDTPPLARGEFSRGVTPRGKPGPDAPRGARQGRNDYTGWFAADKDMAGSYYGYDGPCPPWNDERVHHYTFTLYALDVPRLELGAAFSGKEAREAMQGHVLAQVTLTGVYSLNPSVRW